VAAFVRFKVHSHHGARHRNASGVKESYAEFGVKATTSDARRSLTGHSFHHMRLLRSVALWRRAAPHRSVPRLTRSGSGRRIWCEVKRRCVTFYILCVCEFETFVTNVANVKRKSITCYENYENVVRMGRVARKL